MSNAAAFSIGNGGCTPTNRVVSPQLVAVSNEYTDVGYGRVSTLAEAQTTSIESQGDRLQTHGCIEFYADRLSGGDFDRPGLLAAVSRAIELAKMGKKVRFWVTTPDRIGRDSIEWISLVGKLEKEGIEVWSLDSGRITISTPGDKLMWTMLSATYEFFLNLTKAKIRAAAARRRESGRKMGGTSIFGYQWVDNNTRRVPHPEQWGIARKIAERYLDSEGLGTIVEWLKSDHQISFSKTGLLRWLQSPVLRGHTWHKKVNGIRLPVPLIRYNTHQALISSGEWAQLRYRFETNQSYPIGKTVRACSGVCRCADCKIRLELQTQYRKHLEPYVFFRCRGAKGKKCSTGGTIRYDRVEPAVLQTICSRADDIARATLEPEQPKENPRIVQLRSELETYRQLRDQHGRSELDTIIQNIEREIAHLQSHTAELQADDARLDDLIRAMADPAYWQGLSDAERHQIYHELGVVVLCKGNRIVEVKLAHRHWRKCQ